MNRDEIAALWARIGARREELMAMTKLSRKAAELDGLELFRRLDVHAGETLVSDPDRVDSFLNNIRVGVTNALSRESTVHGWRAQSMFAALVVAMDGCEMLTTIDTGDVFHDGEGVKPPDFFLALRDGRRLVVDVKSIAPARTMGGAQIGVTEIKRLQRFADLYGAELYIACLFSGPGEWVLLPSGSFSIGANGRRGVSTEDAFLRNEMAAIGDFSVGITPPLRLDLFPDPSLPNEVDATGRVGFTVSRVESSVGGTLMNSKTERRIAHFLHLYGTWNDRQVTDVEGGRLRRISFIAEPEQRNPEQEFEIVGRLSSMFTRLFDSTTRGQDGVTALDTHFDPGLMAALIPEDFESTALRIWRFVIQPSSDNVA